MRRLATDCPRVLSWGRTVTGPPQPLRPGLGEHRDQVLFLSNCHGDSGAGDASVEESVVILLLDTHIF